MARMASAAAVIPRGRLEQVSGPAAMLGGALLVCATLIHAAKPRGCVAEECATAAMREPGTLDGALMASSLLLIVIGAVGLVARARASGRFGRAGRLGMFLAALGVAVLVAAGLVQVVFFGGDFAYMPLFVIPSLLLVIAGLVLLAVAVLRSGIMHRWIGVALVTGALAMVGYNEQTAAVLMALPLALAWIAVGYALWSQPPRPPDSNL